MLDYTPISQQLNAWAQSCAGRAADTRSLMATVAKSLEVSYREHFQRRESEGNRQGFPPRHFWTREVARLMSRESDASTATLNIASPAYAHKVHGGTIVPKRGKALTIPKSATAYARGSPRVAGLPLVFIPDLSHKIIGWLVEHEMYSLKGRLRNAKRLGTIHYLLVPSVDQAADPQAEPPVYDIRLRLADDLYAFGMRVLDRAGR